MRWSSMWTMRALLWALSVRMWDLMAGVRTRGAAVCLQRHREQRDGHLLAGGEQNVELAGIGALLNVVREIEQAVRLAAHRGNDDDDIVAPLASAPDFRGNMRDPLEAPDRCAPELLNDQSHGRDESGGERRGRTSSTRTIPRRRRSSDDFTTKPAKNAS